MGNYIPSQTFVLKKRTLIFPYRVNMIKWAAICFWHQKCKLQDAHDSGTLPKKANCNKRGQLIVYQRALWPITMEGRELSFLLSWVLHKFCPGNFTVWALSYLPEYLQNFLYERKILDISICVREHFHLNNGWSTIPKINDGRPYLILDCM